MSASIRSLAVFTAVAGVVAGLATAPPAGALPECTNTSPTTTQCQNAGNAQINTGPPSNNDYPFGWPYWGGGWGGGITIGIGGIGIGI